MATMNVSLPEDLRVRVDALVAAGEFQSNSDYVREIIRRDLKERQGLARLMQLLDEGARGPFDPLDEKGFDAFDAQIRQVIDKAADGPTTR